jgi:hypothetical protein
MIKIGIGFGSVGIPGEEEIVANGNSLLERKLRVKPLLSLSRWRELTYWRSSTTAYKLPLFLGIQIVAFGCASIWTM